MSERDKAIKALMTAINESLSDEALLSFKQVAHYVGSDMSTSEIIDWVYDTRQGDQAVSARDVLDLCDGLNGDYSRDQWLGGEL